MEVFLFLGLKNLKNLQNKPIFMVKLHTKCNENVF